MSERDDLLESLAAHRGFLRYTVAGITDEQARLRTTASELTLGGLIKHVALTEKGWADFIVDVPTPAGGDVKVHHFSERLHFDARNVLLALDGEVTE